MHLALLGSYLTLSFPPNVGIIGHFAQRERRLVSVRWVIYSISWEEKHPGFRLRVVGHEAHDLLRKSAMSIPSRFRQSISLSAEGWPIPVGAILPGTAYSPPV